MMIQIIVVNPIYHAMIMLHVNFAQGNISSIVVFAQLVMYRIHVKNVPLSIILFVHNVQSVLICLLEAVKLVQVIVNIVHQTHTAIVVPTDISWIHFWVLQQEFVTHVQQMHSVLLANSQKVNVHLAWMGTR